MNRHLIILATMLAIAICADPGRADDDAARQLQDYELTNLEGAKHSLSEFRGEVLVVNFWASWCPPCLEELPIMDEWHTDWADRGARVVAISVDERVRNVRRFVENSSIALDVYHDGTDGLAARLELPSLPRTYVLDQSGDIVLVSSGSGDEDLAQVHRTVEQLLAASPTAALDTRATREGAR